MTDIADKFNSIYRDGHWKSGQSVSGSGSELSQTEALTMGIHDFIVRHDVEVVVDCPCGDLHWMRRYLPWSPLLRYIGADIVPEIIERLRAEPGFAGDTELEFVVANVVADALPKCGLLIVRDCLVHFPEKLVFQALENIAAQDCEYVALTTFMAVDRSNTDIELGDWRPLNLLEYPYSLPFPVHVIVEGCTEGDGTEYSDKCLAIWGIDQIRAWNAHRNS